MPLIHKFKFPKEKLIEIPDCQRIYLVYAGHILNELNYFSRLMLIYQQTGSEFAKKLQEGLTNEDRAKMGANSAHILILIRLFAGKLTEGLKFQEKWALDMPWFEELVKNLPQPAKSAYDYKRKYLEDDKKNPSILRVIRNKFGFHYDDKAAKASAKLENFDDDFICYLGNSEGNSVYMGSESHIFKGMAEIMKVNDEQKMIEDLVDKCLELSSHLSNLIGNVLVDLAQKHIGTSSEELGLESKINITSVKLRELRLPFFTEMDENDV